MNSAARPELSILMPVYNESARIDAALRGVFTIDWPFPIELIVVDDGSSDGTRDFLRRYDWPANAQLHFHERNQGKGAAVRTALGKATGRFSAILDADLEYDPRELIPLIEPLQQGLTNCAFGVRVFDGYTSHSFLYVMGNRAVTLAANILFNVYLHDLMTCFKAIRTDIFQQLELRERGFTIEPEIAARVLQRGERIYEVPISYRARTFEEGKKLTTRDGLRVLATLLRCRLRPSGPREPVEEHPTRVDRANPEAREQSPPVGR
jgi:dolichol-phosphate hexosyltransferase